MPADLPALPTTPDGDVELRSLDARLARATDPGEAITLHLERAAIGNRLADWQAALARSEAWIGEAPQLPRAWAMRVRALAAVHRFAAARAALTTLRTLDGDPGEADALAADLDEATGDHLRAAAYREQRAAAHPTAQHLVAWAHNLALADRTDEALAILPRAVAALRGPSARLAAWVMFQWGRLHELRGEHALARRCFELAHARFPGSLATVVHLVETMRATGAPASSTMPLVDAALERFGPMPELLALAGRSDEARQAWEPYLAAFPEAFADHAARFFLAAGRDPARALGLARKDLEARSTAAARALVVEAALAADDPAAACAVVGPLEAGSRAHRFLAWRARSACGDVDRARALATALGIP